MFDRNSRLFHIYTVCCEQKKAENREGLHLYRILVVDDEAKIRLLIRKYAEFEGHQVTEAGNGMEAVTIFRRAPESFDIVIMDVMMPELDGFSAVSEIRKIASRR